MASSTAGPKGNTSRPESKAARRGVGTGARKMRFLQSMVMQVLLALVLAAMAWFSRDEPRTMMLYLWALLIPVGFGVVFFVAHQRGERVRREKTWTAAWEKAEAKRVFGWLGFTVIAWVAGVAAILAFA